MIFAFVSLGIYKLENWPILSDYLVKLAGRSLNTHGVSKRVIYSESVIKMLQHGIEKLNFSNSPFLVHVI